MYALCMAALGVAVPFLMAAREKQLLTQAELAGRAGITRQAIMALEARPMGATAHPATARRLAEALGVQLAELMMTASPAINDELHRVVAETVGAHSAGHAMSRLLEQYVQHADDKDLETPPVGGPPVPLPLPHVLHLALVERSQDFAIRNGPSIPSLTDEINRGLLWAIQHGYLRELFAEPVPRHT